MQNDRLFDEKELEKSWLISYSDLITLLFVIVVIITAVSSNAIQNKLEEVRKAQEAQQEDAKEAIESKDILELKKLELQREIAMLETKRDELRKGLDLHTSERKSSTDKMAALKAQLASALQELNIHFEETKDGLLVRFPEKVLFASGSAELGADGKKAISALAQVLGRFSHNIRIEGYTDNMPITNELYPSNWELSAARAIAVMKEMVNTHQLPAKRFMVAGWGENHPISDNATPEHRALNRRVEVLILAEP